MREEDEYAGDGKLIGVYRTQKDCEAAIKRLKGYPGFRDFVEGFQVHERELNKVSWEEGSISAEASASCMRAMSVGR